MRLSVLLRRVGCRNCGKRMEAVSWLDRYARMTRRLAEAVIQACERLPTKHVDQLFGLHWDSVRLLERRALQAAVSFFAKGAATALGNGRIRAVQRSSLRQRSAGRRYPASAVDWRRSQPRGDQAILRSAGAKGLRSHRSGGGGDGHEHRL